MDRDACYEAATGSHTFVCGRRKWFTRRHVRVVATGRVGPPISGAGSFMSGVWNFSRIH